MEKRIIDLEIIDELDGSGVDAIALVDSPAIEKNFLYFRAEQFVEPKSGESESEYMGRCVPTLINEGKPQDQAVAICISTYENMGKVEMEINTGGLAPYTDQSGPLKKKAVALASVEELGVGDAVSWKTADQNPRGRIREIVKNSKTVPGTDFQIEGSETDPGFIIEIYEQSGEEWKPTGKFVGRKADSILKNVELADDKTVGTYGFANMLFADESKKELVGPVAIPDMEIPRKDDKTKDIYFVKFSKEAVRKMAEKFMREQRLADNNIQHKNKDNAGSYVFESWIVETADDKANTLYDLNVPIGTWMVKMRVVDLATWAKVKSGELKGFSLQGNFVSKEEYAEYLKDKEVYDELKKLVSTF